MFDTDSDGDDKDIQYRKTKEDYLSIIDECNKRGYDVVLSTPDFEFWLLLHHPDAKLDGIKAAGIGSRKYIEKQIRNLDLIPKDMTIKKMDATRYSFYDKNFNYALNRLLSGKYKTDPVDLIDNVGTNVGIMLKKILDGKLTG